MMIGPSMQPGRVCAWSGGAVHGCRLLWPLFLIEHNLNCFVDGASDVFLLLDRLSAATTLSKNCRNPTQTWRIDPSLTHATTTLLSLKHGKIK
jgi:hypothetical protein